MKWIKLMAAVLAALTFSTAAHALECQHISEVCSRNPDMKICKGKGFSGYVKIGGITSLYGRIEYVCFTPGVDRYSHAKILVSRARSHLLRRWCGDVYHPVPLVQISLGGTLYSLAAFKSC